MSNIAFTTSYKTLKIDVELSKQTLVSLDVNSSGGIFLFIAAGRVKCKESVIYDFPFICRIVRSDEKIIDENEKIAFETAVFTTVRPARISTKYGLLDDLDRCERCPSDTYIYAEEEEDEEDEKLTAFILFLETFLNKNL